MNTTASIIPHAPADLCRYMILQEVADALRTGGDDVSSIQAVIATARISIREIVREFGDMNGLVVSLAEMFAASMLELLEICTTQTSFLKKLHAFGNRAVDDHSGLQLKRLFWIALAGATRNAEVGSAFYRHGPGLVVAELAHFFKSAQYAGVLPTEDGHYLASHFMALLSAGRDPSEQLHHRGSNGSAHDGGDVAGIIKMFWAGIQAESEQAESEDAHAVL